MSLSRDSNHIQQSIHYPAQIMISVVNIGSFLLHQLVMVILEVCAQSWQSLQEEFDTMCSTRLVGFVCLIMHVPAR